MRVQLRVMWFGVGAFVAVGAPGCQPADDSADGGTDAAAAAGGAGSAGVDAASAMGGGRADAGAATGAEACQPGCENLYACGACIKGADGSCQPVEGCVDVCNGDETSWEGAACIAGASTCDDVAVCLGATPGGGGGGGGNTCASLGGSPSTPFGCVVGCSPAAGGRCAAGWHCYLDSYCQLDTDLNCYACPAQF